LGVVPTELHTVVLKQVPFNAAIFPLASDTVAMNDRRASLRHFNDAAKVARLLNCSVAAAIDDEYALWIELRDPDSSENGRRRLEEKLRDTNSVLRFVPLSLQFRIKNV
jgi:hypothetical protein